MRTMSCQDHFKNFFSVVSACFLQDSASPKQIAVFADRGLKALSVVAGGYHSLAFL